MAVHGSIFCSCRHGVTDFITSSNMVRPPSQRRSIFKDVSELQILIESAASDLSDQKGGF
jgi:hypothetical protein